MIRKTHKHIKDTMWSMSNAFRGVVFGLNSERNFRTELAIFIVTIIYALYLGFSYLEFSIVLLAGFTVLGAELLNTAIEESWNRLHPDHHEQVGKIKDLASGGVLLVGLGAGLAGLLIFIRHLI
jgi:diacylglycerol kinase (ATP)